MASFRQGRSTTTSLTHRNVPVKGQRIDRIAQFLTAVRTAGAGSVCNATRARLFESGLT